jgi:glycosyltransferase involved in cell wall biosynthesis
MGGGGPDMSKPRVLLFLPSLLAGGAELHAMGLASGLRAQGFECPIMVFCRDRSDLVANMEAARGAIRVMAKGMSDIRGWIKIWRLLNEMKPDVIIAVNQTPLIVSFIEKCALATGAKLACVFHSTEMHESEKQQERMIHWVAPFTDLMIYVGREQMKTWERRGVRPRRAIVIPNGVDLARFNPSATSRAAMRARLGFAEHEVVLGIVAAFRPEKNHADLVRALSLIRDSGAPVKLLAVGDGPTLVETRQLASELEVADMISFVGEQRNVADFMAACDGGALCSHAETFPLAVLEFLAMGVPMIVSGVSGALELVEDGVNGLVYPPGDTRALAASIKSFADPAIRMKLARQARASVLRYSYEAMIDNYAREIEALAS